MTATKLTALEYANEREHVVIRYASQGAPAGQDSALLGETELPFDLEEIEGQVDEEGNFEATNLNDGSGAHGWQFHDWNSNVVYMPRLRVDPKVWQEQYDDYMARG